MLSKTPPKIPVMLLTGFLGSGKTTLLNRLLGDGVKTAVVINEFGNTPVDQDLLQAQGMPLTVLSGGCLCCQVKGALAPTLKNLRITWDNAADKPFERIIIEASGVASPEPILDTLLREPWVSKRYQLQQVVTTLAIPSALDQLQRFAEARAQLAWADVLLLSHADLANSDQIETLQNALQSLAPTIRKIPTNLADFDTHLLAEAAIPLVRRLPNNGHSAGHDFHTVSLYLTQTPAWPRLRGILEELLQHYPDDLLRIKGVVYPTDDCSPLAIQGGNGRLYPASPLPARATDDHRSRLVFIAANQNESWLAQLQSRLGDMIDARAIRRH